jgi:hypothetical protein
MLEYMVRARHPIENPALSFKPAFDIAAVRQHGHLLIILGDRGN